MSFHIGATVSTEKIRGFPCKKNAMSYNMHERIFRTNSHKIKLAVTTGGSPWIMELPRKILKSLGTTTEKI